MAKTAAIRVLDAANCTYENFSYKYIDKGGTRSSSAALDVDEHYVIKTLIFDDENQIPMIVLMHGDEKVSTKSLARIRGVKRIMPCSPQMAQKHSGYQVGGTSPFGTKTSMQTYMQSTIGELPEIYINGGRRGFLVKLRTADLISILKPELVSVLA